MTCCCFRGPPSPINPLVEGEMRRRKISDRQFVGLSVTLAKMGFNGAERLVAIDTCRWVLCGGASRKALGVTPERFAAINDALPERGVLCQLSPEEVAGACRWPGDLSAG